MSRPIPPVSPQYIDDRKVIFSTMITWTEAYDGDALAALIASATVLGADLKAILFTNVVTPSKVLVLGDLTQPTNAGLATQAVVLGPPVRDPQRGIVSLAAGLIWQQSGSPGPVTIAGIAYTYGAGPALAGVELFESPIPLTDLLDSFTSVLEYVQTNDGVSFTTTIQ